MPSIQGAGGLNVPRKPFFLHRRPPVMCGLGGGVWGVHVESILACACDFQTSWLLRLCILVSECGEPASRIAGIARVLLVGLELSSSVMRDELGGP